MSYPTTCPACKADLKEPIEDEELKEYHGIDHYCRASCIVSGGLASMPVWRCPDCKAIWPSSPSQ